jgi:hypothetical protein
MGDPTEKRTELLLELLHPASPLIEPIAAEVDAETEDACARSTAR